MEQRVPFVRVLKLSRLLETFFIASVTSILVICTFLASTGYPQLGGHGLHIAHLLWGGLLMLIALVLSLASSAGRLSLALPSWAVSASAFLLTS